MAKKSKPRTSNVSSPKPAQGNGQDDSPTPQGVLKQAETLGIEPEATPSMPLGELTLKVHGLLKPLELARAKLEEDQRSLDERELAHAEREEKLAVRAKAIEEKAMAVDREKGSLRAGQAELEKAERALEARKVELETSMEARQEERRKELDAQESVLLAREEKVAARETEAAAGFVRQRTEMLASVEEAKDRLLAAIDARERAETEAAFARVAEFEKRKAEVLREVESRVTKVEADIEEREDRLAKAAKDVDRRARRLELEASDLEEQRNDLQNLVEKHAEDRVMQADASVKRLREQCARLEGELEERRRAAQILANEAPEQTIARMNALKAKVSELQNELASRPTEEEMRELERVRDERANLQNANFGLERELLETRRRHKALQVDVDQVEAMRDTIVIKEKHVELLRAAVDQLREEVDSRLDQDRGKPVFATLTKMDNDSALLREHVRFWAPNAGAGGKLDLATFSQDLQARIGRGDKGQPDLFFALDDIRGLLGGLAMSRMHLYQGISGIGKSSLPRRFAHAVGGICESVSVQAGWRDKQDLFGYFNAFDKAYHETEFVKALYKAQLPQWKNRLFIILLDEMNLSHPEQYGADILDVLERTEHAERRFQLLSSDTGKREMPKFLADGAILLPKNVWFVGTANHDETTKDFADKTYDRSFVLELPGTPPKFSLQDVEKREPVNINDIEASFQQAKADFGKDATQALSWMERELRQVLVEDFGISWGGRFETQAKSFIPVFVATGCDRHAALDRLLATRVLRRIKGRHELTKENFEALRDVLHAKWDGKGKEQGPKTSLALVHQEARRLGHTL